MSSKDGKKEIRVPVIQREADKQKKAQLGIDLTLCAPDWVPKATSERIKFTARIYAYDGDSEEWQILGDEGEKRKITFSFKEVSKEPGVCMNFPAKDKSNKNPDLFFPDDGFNSGKFDFSKDQTEKKRCPSEIEKKNDNPAHKRHYLEATTKQGVSEATIEIRCEDYGASGILQATAPDCETLNPREKDSDCSQTKGSNEVKIPRDEDSNKIADGASQNAGGAPATDDKDDKPAWGPAGDGLTNYEEYRGFIVLKSGGGKEHKRVKTDEKDIFIFDKDKLTTGYFSETGLKIHFIPGPEYYGGNSKDDPKGKLGTGRPEGGTQIINFNSGYAHGGDQHGIRLVNEKLPGVAGFTFASDAKAPGPPGNINRVAIDRNAILKRNIPNKLQKTTAHELGHAVCIKHHGNMEKNWKKHVHGEEPKWEKQRGGPVEPGGLSEAAGGVSSGDVKCVMRYDNLFTRWCHDDHKCIHGIFSPPDKESPGSSFCDANEGSGVNKFRDINDAVHENRATKGNCRSQIIVKDW